MSSTPPPILLKPLDASHSSQLQAVYDASAEFFAQSTGQTAPDQEAGADLAAAADDEARHLLGVFLAGELAGVIDLRFDDPQPLDTRLGLVLLVPSHRRQGLGSWALRILEAWLRRDTPTEGVRLSVPAQDHAAQSFFAANGYSFTGQSARVLSGDTRMRLLEMRKSLV